MSLNETVRRVREIQLALDEVTPFDNRVAGLTNVDAIYAAGCKALGAKNYRDLLLGEGAAKAAFGALRAAGAKPIASKYVAMDSKAAAARVERFPNAGRLRNGY